jgi:hypothetical protein
MFVIPFWVTVTRCMYSVLAVSLGLLFHLSKWGVYGYTYSFFYYINFNKMHMLQNLFYLTTALHVLDVTITHLQEHKTTVTTASGKCYTVLLSAAIVEGLKLQLVHESSSQQYGVTVTRYCIYIWLCSWRWMIVTPETCRAAVR